METPALTRLATLRLEEEELVFERFDLDDAWLVGSAIVERAHREGLGLAVSIRRAHTTLFHAALPGATPDQDAWLQGKIATVLRMERSTAVLEAEFAEAGFDPSTTTWLPAPAYVLGGGGVPIRVRDTGVVAAVAVSGLASDQDHAVIVDALRAHLSWHAQTSGA